MLQPISYQVPIYGHPHYIQTMLTAPAYQSGYVYNSLLPSVIYEPKTAGQLLASNIPLLASVQRQPPPQDCNQHCESLQSETAINYLIDKKVREQISKYNNSINSDCPSRPCLPVPDCCNEVDKCAEQLASLSCNQCTHHQKQQPCMNLDERIQLIRAELNLPAEREQNKLIAKLDAERHRQEQMGFFTDDRSECATSMSSVEPREHRSRRRSLDGDSTCARFRSRSKSFDDRVRAESQARSRSRSASRGGRRNAKPIWMPTGNNDFTRTLERRDKMIVQQERRQYMLDSLDTLNRNKVFEKPARVSTAFPSLNRNPRFLNSFETEKPRPTKQRTADSFDYNTSTSHHQQHQQQQQQPEASQAATTYIRATFAPMPERRTETTTVTYSRPAAAPMYYERTAYPLAKEYYQMPAQPKTNTLNCFNMRPVAATKGGAIYSCSNKNELHYVSDKARNTVQICTSNNGYSRNADNRTRIIKSDTTVIHD